MSDTLNDPTKTYYVTTPIYYVNGLPHVGSGLTTITADVLARYHKMRGYQTFFLTGTDENATKVQEAAAKAGVPTLDFVEKLANAFQECWQQLHIGYDDFIRTTEPRHTRVVQHFFAQLFARGYVYKDIYEGWYSVSDETFFRDSDVENGVAKETGKPVERVQEEDYFFRLSAFGDKLLAHIEANPDFLLPDFRRNEVIAFIKEGLRDICITRANKGWGIPFPGDESKVIYVWFDALINYLTVSGWPDNPDWQALWPADAHLMAKEIFVRFHATLWPAMLMALDLPLPKQVYAHGWWTISGSKGGKTGPSLPHPTRFTQLIAERSGASFALAADAQRYILCREMNYNLDTEFTVENCLRRFNTDLANDLGNLLNRTLNMVQKYFDGKVPATTAHDAEIAALALQVQDDYTRALAEFRLNVALESVWKLVARMNKYIDEQAPWTLYKAAQAGDAAAQEQLARVLYACLEATRIVSVFVTPFMPVAAQAIRSQLGLADREATWDDLTWGGLQASATVGPAQPLFPRLQELTVDDETLKALGSSYQPDAELNSPEQKASNAAVSDTASTNPNTPEAAGTTPAPGTPLPPPATTEEAPGPITIDDFMKVELKVGEVLAAEPVPNATKLLRLTVQLGEEDTRTILAGIAEYYQPEELIGRKVVVVANLQPRKMRGIESQGMLLAADVEGRAVLLKPDDAVTPGTRIR